MDIQFLNELRERRDNGFFDEAITAFCDGMPLAVFEIMVFNLAVINYRFDTMTLFSTVADTINAFVKETLEALFE